MSCVVVLAQFYLMIYLCCLLYVIGCYISVVCSMSCVVADLLLGSTCSCSMLSVVVSLLFVLCYLMLYLCCLFYVI